MNDETASIDELDRLLDDGARGHRVAQGSELGWYPLLDRLSHLNNQLAPPLGLQDRLKSEVFDQLPNPREKLDDLLPAMPPLPSQTAQPRFPAPSWPGLIAAALLLVVLAGGWVARELESGPRTQSAGERVAADLPSRLAELPFSSRAAPGREGTVGDGRQQLAQSDPPVVAGGGSQLEISSDVVSLGRSAADIARDTLRGENASPWSSLIALGVEEGRRELIERETAREESIEQARRVLYDSLGLDDRAPTLAPDWLSNA